MCVVLIFEWTGSGRTAHHQRQTYHQHFFQFSSFINQIEQFLCHWTHKLEGHKCSGCKKGNFAHPCFPTSVCNCQPQFSFLLQCPAFTLCRALRAKIWPPQTTPGCRSLIPHHLAPWAFTLYTNHPSFIVHSWVLVHSGLFHIGILYLIRRSVMSPREKLKTML
jgi:hypothetical protein